MVLMLQQEAAQRYTAQPGSKSFGGISVFLQAAYETAPGHRVAARAFTPGPTSSPTCSTSSAGPSPLFSHPQPRL
jgi:16S rRNA (adenine1518-N6/adenine1519-N6)-dimethyltransferase